MGAAGGAAGAEGAAGGAAGGAEGAAGAAGGVITVNNEFQQFFVDPHRESATPRCRRNCLLLWKLLQSFQIVGGQRFNQDMTG